VQLIRRLKVINPNEPYWYNPDTGEQTEKIEDKIEMLAEKLNQVIRKINKKTK